MAPKRRHKGKAKKLVPVLELGHDARTGGVEVQTQGRAPLPKGYLAYKPTSPSSTRR